MPNDTNTLKTKVDATSEAARETVSAALDTAETATEVAGGKLRSLGADLSSRASETAEHLRDAAASRIDGARGALADAGDRLADTLRRAADKPEAPELQTRTLTALSDGAAAVADTLRDRTFSEMAGDVRALARRHPAAFAAGAAVVGFAVARMLRANHRGGSQS